MDCGTCQFCDLRAQQKGQRVRPMLTPDQFASLGYLGILLAVIGGYFFVANRANLGKTLQFAAIWGLIFIGSIVAVGLWMDIRDRYTPRQTVALGGVVEVDRAQDGHFYLTLDINSVPTRFVVDTGATDIVLSRDDAMAAGIDVDLIAFSGSATTANGVVNTAPVVLGTVALGERLDTQVSAVVNGGALHESLLGMTYLRRFTRLEITQDRLILEP